MKSCCHIQSIAVRVVTR